MGIWQTERERGRETALRIAPSASAAEKHFCKTTGNKEGINEVRE